MYRHIMIPTDGSSLSEGAVRHGVALARTLNARVSVITVTPTFQTAIGDPFMATGTSEQYRAECKVEAERYLGAARAIAQTAAVPCETIHAERDHPYEAIIDAANDKGCDLICMASHGRRGVAALVIGSETNKVLTHSKIPVLVCR